MTKTDLIAQVAANTEMSKKSAELAVNAAFDALSKAMAEGEKITISGFGTFEIRERAERQGINPRTRFFCKTSQSTLRVASSPVRRCGGGQSAMMERACFSGGS